MAQSQPYPQVFMQQNKGTLMPGQMIAVNKYTVQVERYLSQGGFAHVYLVRTSAPVYGTTHHVLKRIAVPNETMLTEVKKEVDVMRILKGHPNIVHLIDAASHRMSNGAYEVFILMEFCPGGGIIDMMNRRLRERLTESEILTIFVNVCEGLAAMHALKPPLLHRDLKVENILQSSATSYKLCDFGSATPVGRVPSNNQEIRALEADLNRHTTLQYRAPEMVDVYLRRPIDEKSDIWALGVLLYKLCYYTTPFEEHGPLAILNVQYKIPPYPAYSPQMQALIASMLREHGVHRPTVFEILNHVHHLRGTKPLYSYTVPPKQPPLPPLPPRPIQAPPPLQALSPNVPPPSPKHPNALDGLVAFKPRSQPSPAPAPARNAGVEARERVLDAIAPMRRGRPALSHSREASPPASPRKEKASDIKIPPTLGADFKSGADDRPWGGIQGHKSGAGGTISLNTGGADDAAWGMAGRAKESEKPSKPTGFDNDFSSSMSKGFGDSFEPKAAPPTPPKPQLPTPPPIQRPSLSSLQPSSRSPVKRVPISRSQNRDAFEGLGLAAQPPPQTMGEARRTRTGLASIGSAPSLHFGQSANRSASQFLNASSASQETTLGTANTTYRPPSAHSPAPPPSAKPQAQPPQTPQTGSWRSHAKATSSSKHAKDLTVEERFPSLEELDRQFGSPLPTPSFPDRPPSRAHGSYSQPAEKTHPVRPPSRNTGNITGGLRHSNLLGVNGTGSGVTHSVASHAGNRYDGTRSQQVTGAAMRESKMAPSRHPTASNWDRTHDQPPAKSHESPALKVSTSSRPQLTRKHRSSLSIKPSPQVDNFDPSSLAVPDGQTAPALPPRPPASPRQTPRDWLTGPEDDGASAPVLRESPSKRASFIERSPVMIQKPLEAESVQTGRDWSSQFTDHDKQKKEREAQKAEEEARRRKADQAAKEREEEQARERKREAEKAREKERAREKADQMDREREREREKGKAFERDRERQAKESERRRDRQREDNKEKSSRDRVREQRGRSSPTKAAKTFAARTATGSSIGGRPLPLVPLDTKPQPLSTSSSNGLTENWSPIAVQTKRSSSSSSGEDGPEEPNGLILKERSREKLKDHSRTESGRTTPLKDAGSMRQGKHKGRQGSVHDLVDLWDGGADKDKDKGTPSKTGEKRRGVLLAPSTPAVADPPGTASKPMFSPDPPETTPNTAGYILTSARPPNTHRRDGSTILTPPGYRALPAPIPTSRSHSGRSRPQSMIISPGSKGYPPEPSIASALPAISQSQQNLSPPALDAKTIRRSRRSSVSNVVQRYEAISSVRPGQGSPAVSPSKPLAGLSVKVASAGAAIPLSSALSNSSIPSPATAAIRFPKISPTASPVLPKASLGVPDNNGNASHQRDSSRGRTSPSPSFTGLPSRVSPGFTYPSSPKPSDHATGSGGGTSGLPTRRTSPFEPIKSHATPSSSSHEPPQTTTTIVHPFPLRKQTAIPLTEDTTSNGSILRSPSPERPYQGVSRLIDRWQKAVDDSGETNGSRSSFAPRKVGTVGSLSGRGR